jgi:TDG/mug DNA glycosylase family protein
MNRTGFDPVADAAARILILGTLPSVQSLERREYYGNRTNQFWRIMGDLVGAGPDVPYAQRIAILIANHIALWDGCRSATRTGSLDAKIQRSTIVANDFAAFLAEHARVALIAFNGSHAEQIFRRHSAALDVTQPIRFEVLPSTSRAHTIPYEEKLDRWRNCPWPLPDSRLILLPHLFSGSHSFRLSLSLPASAVGLPVLPRSDYSNLPASTSILYPRRGWDLMMLASHSISNGRSERSLY